jgi:aldose 1-epimerase
MRDASRNPRLLWSATALVALAACTAQPTPPPPAATPAREASKASVRKEAFGSTADGGVVELYTLTNAGGMEVRAMTYGGIIVSLRVPDRTGALGDVVLGYDSLDGYVKASPYFGAIIGRYGNRIARGRFKLDGKEYKLATNNGPNALHGGVKGFDKVVWKAESFQDQRGVGVVFTYTSADGEEGYPGKLDAKVTYTLADDNSLGFEYHAVTDKPTPVNLTQHSYFNLAGDGSGDILGQELMMKASRFTPVDKTLIPTGELKSVEGTPFDFRTATAIGARIEAKDQQIKFGLGYDHNWVLDREPGSGMQLAARVHDPASGRVMEVTTTEPGLQFYSGNFLDGTITGKGGHVYKHRAGMCLETQHYPDSPNKPDFPSTVLKPGEEYRSHTVYAFSVQKP